MAFLWLLQYAQCLESLRCPLDSRKLSSRIGACTVPSGQQHTCHWVAGARDSCGTHAMNYFLLQRCTTRIIVFFKIRKNVGIVQ